MFLRSDFGLSEAGAAGAVALAPMAPRLPALEPATPFARRFGDWLNTVDLVPDLGVAIGSTTWWRGVATCFGLCAAAIATAPSFAPVQGATPPVLGPAQFDQMRAQMIAPLAFGGDSGLRMAATDAVAPLTSTPERPRIELAAAVGQGDSFAHMLQRAGVGRGDADKVLGLIGGLADPDAIAAGTPVRIVLGRRSSRTMPRPLDQLAVRARLDLAIDISRVNGALDIRAIPIAVDDTPLRIRGTVGDSLYRSARAAGADPVSIQSYLKVIANQLSISRDVRAGDRFDIVVAHRRAATGETETGELLFAGLDRQQGKSVNMLRWSLDGRSEWFEASGVGKARQGMTQPVSGRLSSGYGMRRHPLLGYARMHQGVDYAAPSGAPIYAANAGRVVYAGWHGGHGKYVRLAHGGQLGTGYGHMSRIAVQSGDFVRQGQVIGYVGSTGLSTGPHLHYEVYRGGATVNPLSVKFEQAPQLAGAGLRAFKARLAELKSLPVGVIAPQKGTGALVRTAAASQSVSSAPVGRVPGVGFAPHSR